MNSNLSQPQTIKIRQATQLDFQNIAALQTESWKDSYSEILPDSFIEQYVNRIITRH